MRASIREAKGMHVAIPLVILTLYFVSFSWFLSWLLPYSSPNVNADFVDRAWKCSLLAAALYLILLALFRTLIRLDRVLKRCIPSQACRVRIVALKTRLESRPAFRNGIEKFDLILILLPLAPVVQYIVNNQDILSPLGSLYVLAVFVVFALLFVIIMPMMLGAHGSTKTLMLLGLAFAFTIANMASLSADFHWFERGSLGIQLFVLGGTFAVGLILYNFVGRKSLYLVVAVFFVANSAIQFAPLAPRAWAEIAGRTHINNNSSQNSLVELVGSRSPLSTPDIYLLVYDAYVTNETMLAYGIDNSNQEEYLETLGFEQYPHTYSVGAESVTTMSRTLNASAEYYGRSRRAASGDGITQNLLRSFGYETYGVFATDYFFQGVGSSYDFSYPEASSGHELLIKAIFTGEFRFDFASDKPTYEQFIEHKMSVLQSVPEKPRFVYIHSPHPGHSQNSGRCLPNETELYGERLTKANDEMKQDIEIITLNDPGAIIVVAGDHGPYLTKNCVGTGGDYDISEVSRLDIQDRFGTFLAIKWPTDSFSEYDDITVLQDVFPAILAYLFQDDGLLAAKVPSTTLYSEAVSGASVSNGVIHGGVNDGEPLFIDQ